MSERDQFWISPESEDRILREAEHRRRRQQNVQARVTPELAARLSQLATQHPNLAPGVVASAGFGGVSDQQAAHLGAIDDGGGVFDAVGDFLGSAAAAVTGAIDNAADKVYEQAVKPIVRGVFTLADGLSQEVQRPLTAALAADGNLLTNPGAFREAYRGYGDSALRNVVQGDVATVDAQGAPVEGGMLGHGFFPAGQAQARANQERTLTIAGQSATFGRAATSALMGEIVAPGDKAYDWTAGLVQFAADVALDPLAWATGGASKAIKAGRILHADDAGAILRAAGAVDAPTRRTILIEQTQELFRDKNLLEKLSETDAYTIYQSFNKSAARSIDRRAVAAIGETTDQAVIAEELLNAVRVGDLSETGFYKGARFRKVANDRKLAGLSPNGLVDANDLDTATARVDSLLRQAHVPREVRADVFGKMARLDDGDAAGLFDVVTDALSEVGRHLDDGTVSDDYARRVREMVRIFDGDREAFTAYGVDELADPIQSPLTKRKIVQTGADGAEVEVLMPTPQISSELASLAFHLPDPQDIRRAATKSDLLRKVYTSKGWDVTESALSSLTRSVFKPLVLLRPAYVARIGLEEQARLSAAGYDSMMSHPFRYIMANIVNREAATDLLGQETLVARARAAGAISRDATGVLDDAVKSRARLYGTITKSDDESFVTAWRHELGQLAAAPEAAALAASRGSLDDFVVWARESAEGKRLVDKMSKVSPEARTLATSDDALREWGDSIWRRIEAKTGRDEELLDLVATGQLGGGKGRVVSPDRGNVGTIISEDAGRSLVEFVAEDGARATKWFQTSDLRPAGGAQLWQDEAAVNSALRARLDRAPVKVKIENATQEGSKLRGHYDRGLRFLFDWITAKPTSYLARYPAFRQNMVENTAALMENLATDGLRREAFESAVKNLKPTKVELKRLGQAAQDASERAARRGVVGEIDTLDDLNELVVLRSAEQVKELLFDVTKRSAAQDTLDTILPFLDAWKEVTTTWAGLVKDNPGWFIRAQAGYRSLKDSGAFYVNEHGDEVFSMPGGGLLAKALGLPQDGSIKFEGRVQGLNLVTQGVGPGFGPVLQWGSGAFLPDTQDFATLREWIAPFGSDVDAPTDLSNPGTFLAGLTPAWAEKVINAWTGGDIDPVQWNSTVGDAMKTLATVGDYRPGDPADAQRLLKDAEKAGRWTLFMRGLAQGVAPTGPSGTWQIATDGTGDAIPTDWDPEADPDARWHTVGVLASEYRRLAETFGYDLATERFIQTYGIEPFYLAQAKTKTVRDLPVTTTGNSWAQENRDVVNRYPSVIGYFAPADEGEGLDYGVYRDQIERGDRQSLTAQQQLELANQTKARAIYYAVKSRTENLPKPQRDRARFMVKGALEASFPGWQAGVLGVGEAADNEERIRQLIAATQDEALKDTAVYEPLRVYLTVRARALAIAQERGVSTLNNQASADLRERLGQAGMILATRSPAFGAVWQRVLSREVET